MKLIIAVIKPFKLDDGEIFVFGLDQVLRIRTGEAGDGAL